MTEPSSVPVTPAKKRNWFARHKLLTAVGVILTLIVIGSAAGGGGKDQSAAKKNASPKTATAPRTTPSPRAPHTTPSPTGAPAGCLDVPTTVLQMIASGEEKGVGGLRLSNGKAVRSPDFKKVFFVAADVTAPGVSGYSGVWSVNDLQSPGLILAVDGFAQKFTVWPDADKTDARISRADPSVNRAKDCLR